MKSSYTKNLFQKEEVSPNHFKRNNMPSNFVNNINFYNNYHNTNIMPAYNQEPFIPIKSAQSIKFCNNQ